MLLPGAEQAVEVVPGSARVGVAQDFAQDVPEAVAVAPDPPLINGGVSGGDQNDDAMSAVAAAADAFETAADAGDAIAATDALRAITQAARTPGAARDANRQVVVQCRVRPNPLCEHGSTPKATCR